ncbi:hypothetical protein FEM48_Zijuj01G0201600 [Ziziphus jujuba var. spinosa]|uniref:Uncharacterized protein n=1 Tax=Ziziphus jujuba var. spinosa TaxID=714518 RepID=A0A978W3B1_ZIZJJ|nr:hypothetical protein FEM48_Zijuj01G0201600 [Ziziphus jujuba var. spinosa]
MTSVPSSSIMVLPSFEQQFSDLPSASNRFKPSIMYTRRSCPQSLSGPHSISYPTTLQIQSVAVSPASSVRRSSRVSIPLDSLVYLTITRPDISFTVQQVSQFLQTPRHLHLAAVHRIIRYVHGLDRSGQDPVPVWCLESKNGRGTASLAAPFEASSISHHHPLRSISGRRKKLDFGGLNYPSKLLIAGEFIFCCILPLFHRSAIITILFFFFVFLH